MPVTKIDDNLGQFGKIHSKELATTLRSNFAILLAAIPVGQIVPILVHLPNVPDPDPNYWQACDGSEITNPNSPLRSLPGVPNYTPVISDERYPKMIQSLGLVGNSGGVNEYNFVHSHTIVPQTNDGQDVDEDKDGAEDVKPDHSHSLSTDMNTAADMNPEYYTVKYYMRIQ